MNVIFTTIFLFFCFTISAQSISREVISNTGKSTLTPDFMVSYTVGEAIGNALFNREFILNQGFEQIRFDTLSVGLTDDLSIYNISVYPNPTYNKVFIQIDSDKYGLVHCELFDALGKQMQSSKNFTSNTYIDLSYYATGIYFLRLSLEGSEKFNVVKIEKIN